MTLLERFKLLAEEFIPRGDTEILAHLSIADEIVRKSIRKPVRDNIVVYLAAHYMDSALKRKGAGGQVTSVTEGRLNINYAINNNIKSDFDLSSYGRSYQDLLKSVTITPLTRSCFL